MKRSHTLSPRRRRAAVAGLAVVAAVLLVGLVACHWPRPLADRLPFTLPAAVEFVGDGRAAGNCPLSRTDPEDPAHRLPSDDLLNAADFAFAMGEGSGMMGYDEVKVWADGRCQYTGRDWTVQRTVAWKRATFTTDARTVADLRRLLADVGYGSLAKGYHADVQDGTQWYLKVTAAGRRKGVYCNNHFPVEAVRVSAFLRERVVGPNQAAIDAGGPVQINQMDQWAEFEQGL